jgi:hypothetical protein
MPHEKTMTKEIRLPAPHPRLRPRLEADLRHPGHPGAAVRIGEDLYEVVAADNAGGEWIYRLEPWTDQEVIRTFVDWGEGAAGEFAAGLHAEKAQERRNFLAWGAQIFLGFLPAQTQDRLLGDKGLDPARATFWSAGLESLIALPVVVPFLIGLFAGGIGGVGGWVPAWVGLLACVALGDGIFRLVTVLATGEPIGSVFLVLLGLRLRTVRSRPAAGDEILEIGESVNVVSPVPKVWWERAGGVTYKGEPYILAGWDRERTKYSYRFRRGGEGFPGLDPALEEVRNRSSDMSHVFAILWGFLPPDCQETLEFYGRYRSRPYVLISVGLNALVALALMGPGLTAAAKDRFEVWGLFKLAIAVYLFTECLLRLFKVLKGGRAIGSVVGLLVRPLYDRVIKDRPAPRS